MLALLDETLFDLCVYQLCLERPECNCSHPYYHRRSDLLPLHMHLCVHIQSHKPGFCFFSLAVPALALPAHTTSTDISFFLLLPPFFYFLFLYLCCLFLLSLPLSVCLSFSVSPSFFLSPFLWLAVSLGLCTFLAGKSEALSKHQLPRSAQRNPTWLFLHSRPPLLTPPLSSQLLHSLSHKYPPPHSPTPSNLSSPSLCRLLLYTSIFRFFKAVQYISFLCATTVVPSY